MCVQKLVFHPPSFLQICPVKRKTGFKPPRFEGRVCSWQDLAAPPPLDTERRAGATAQPHRHSCTPDRRLAGVKFPYLQLLIFNGIVLDYYYDDSVKNELKEKYSALGVA